MIKKTLLVLVAMTALLSSVPRTQADEDNGWRSALKKLMPKSGAAQVQHSVEVDLNRQDDLRKIVNDTTGVVLVDFLCGLVRSLPTTERGVDRHAGSGRKRTGRYRESGRRAAPGVGGLFSGRGAAHAGRHQTGRNHLSKNRAGRSSRNCQRVAAVMWTGPFKNGPFKNGLSLKHCSVAPHRIPKHDTELVERPLLTPCPLCFVCWRNVIFSNAGPSAREATPDNACQDDPQAARFGHYRHSWKRTVRHHQQIESSKDCRLGLEKLG